MQSTTRPPPPAVTSGHAGRVGFVSSYWNLSSLSQNSSELQPCYVSQTEVVRLFWGQFDTYNRGLPGLCGGRKEGAPLTLTLR